MKTKFCPKCKKKRLIKFFGKNKSREDGFQVYCKNCNKEYHRQYTQTEKWKEKRKSFDRIYRQENKEKINSYKRKYRKNNIEYREYVREYKSKNKERHNIYAENRRVQKKESAGFTFTQWKILLKLYNNSCAYCGAKENITIDHVVSLKNNGKHDISNIVPACGSCNSSKREKNVSDWFNKGIK